MKIYRYSQFINAIQNVVQNVVQNYDNCTVIKKIKYFL